eukprot:TRINITY_DN4113_c0_g2_i1.p1 TRINITY_DN4113_c0_g2~~TRINITY_DN4113_c0_g2_i1.p1  ORF type:complete len:441 (+),score=102.06 TRINITY_DN4113_c0_g2_i1:96-1418(+)
MSRPTSGSAMASPELATNTPRSILNRAPRSGSQTQLTPSFTGLDDVPGKRVSPRAADANSTTTSSLSKSPSFGKFGGSFGPQGSSSSLMERDGVESRGARGPRKSLATLAFEQASENRSYAKYVDDSMQGFTLDSEELRMFLERRQSVQEGCGHSLGRFVDDIQSAMVTRAGMHKAAEKLLETIGREYNPANGAPLELVAKKEEGLGVPSTILEHAARKQSELLEGSPKRTETSGTHTMTTARMTMPNGGSSPQGPMAAAKRKHRRELIERFRPGATENQAALLQSRMQREPLHKQSTLYKDVLPPESRHSNVMKYNIKNPPKVGRVAPSAALQSTTPNVKGRHVQEQELVTVVTGPVDYASLLEQQKEHTQLLADANAEYTNLIDAYDRIQFGIQRRFSALIKQKTPITGVKQPSPLDAPMLPDIPSPPSATMQPLPTV